MKHLITLLIMALLMAGAADAKVPKRQTKKKKATTTATTKSSKRVRSAPTPILPPQRDLTEAMKRAFQSGVTFTNYYRTIGDWWYFGEYCEKDEAEALRWYYLAAEEDEDGDAECEVGEAYHYGYGGVKVNYFEAAKWYARAKAHGTWSARHNPDLELGLLLDSGWITNEEFRIATEKANLNVQEAKNDAIASERAVSARVEADRRGEPYYGTWTSARGATFTIERGPYLTLRGAGKFKGEWTSDGRLYVSFGYPDEITLKYSNGYLYDRDGRMHWRVP